MRSFEAGTSGKEREADHSSMTRSCTGGAFQPGLQRKTLSQKHKTSNRTKAVCGSAGRVLAWHTRSLAPTRQAQIIPALGRGRLKDGQTGRSRSSLATQ